MYELVLIMVLNIGMYEPILETYADPTHHESFLDCALHGDAGMQAFYNDYNKTNNAVFAKCTKVSTGE